jgi:hypothetical protein
VIFGTEGLCAQGLCDDCGQQRVLLTFQHFQLLGTQISARQDQTPHARNKVTPRTVRDAGKSSGDTRRPRSRDTVKRQLRQCMSEYETEKKNGAEGRRD